MTSLAIRSPEAMTSSPRVESEEDSYTPTPAQPHSSSPNQPAHPSSSPSSTNTQSSTGADPKQEGFFQSVIGSNPYFSAGFGLMAVGAGLTILRQGTTAGASLLRRQLLVTLEIPSKDKSYLWFLHWMSSQSRNAAMTGSATMNAGGATTKATTTSRRPGLLNRWSDRLADRINKRSQFLAVQTEFKQHDNGSVSTRFNLVPGNGKHLICYRGAWIQVERTRDAKMMDLSTGAPWETVTLTTLSSDRHVFSELLQEAQKMALMNQEGKTVIYTSWGAEWRPFGQPRKRRLLQSVILADGIGERVVRDVKEFVKNEKWYDDRGKEIGSNCCS